MLIFLGFAGKSDFQPKIQIGEVREKPKQKGGLAKKEGLGEFANLTGEGSRQERGGGTFEGG